jgi:hypothetical protein
MIPVTYVRAALTLGSDAEHVVRELRTAFAQLGNGRTDALLTALTGYVHAMKTDGFRAEQVVILVNRAMDEAGMRRPEECRGSFIDGVVTHCIEEYYRA